ncbi:alpha/beta hydrolase fold domain-containing protein [Streptomyces sp. NPDC001508]|uniref:alpha/beta hydrolase fold domain-containing protein n=1 Tax=Streptomyces sp. NPDC001508 TaxID=3154656 RepID=UPI003331DD8B
MRSDNAAPFDEPDIGPPVPFDPELAAVLEATAEAKSAIAVSNPLMWHRKAIAGVADLTDKELSVDGTFAVSERAVPGPKDGDDISLLICLPTAATAPASAIYFIHGGGMLAGTSRSRSLAPLALDVAAELGSALISVEYRLAPEHPHPGPVEDCYAGLAWTVEHADELGIDPERVVVAGGSAGGGLAAAVALLARDRDGPKPVGQLLHWPMLDDRNDTRSARQMDGLGVWDRSANQVGWTALLGSARGGADVSPYAAPARADDLSGLPPAFIDVGSAETFRDEAVAYASRIWDAGGSAELHVWPGGYHGFVSSAPQAALSRAAKAAVVPWLRRIVGQERG